jgi:hypothetical protein
VADSNRQTDVDLDPASGVTDVTGEVGSEGGTPGDVESGRDQHHGTGSEAGETWQPGDRRVTKIVRDETGRGRRSP